VSNIVDRLRDRAYSTKAGDALCEDSAALIEVLQWRDKVRSNVIDRLCAEVKRLRDGAVKGCETVRLTDDERNAIEWYAEFVGGPHAPTLRSMLERLK
jgi:hypothetical protein